MSSFGVSRRPGTANVAVGRKKHKKHFSSAVAGTIDRAGVRHSTKKMPDMQMQNGQPAVQSALLSHGGAGVVKIVEKLQNAGAGPVGQLIFNKQDAELYYSNGQKWIKIGALTADILGNVNVTAKSTTRNGGNVDINSGFGPRKNGAINLCIAGDCKLKIHENYIRADAPLVQTRFLHETLPDADADGDSMQNFVIFKQKLDTGKIYTVQISTKTLAPPQLGIICPQGIPQIWMSSWTPEYFILNIYILGDAVENLHIFWNPAPPALPAPQESPAPPTIEE